MHSPLSRREFLKLAGLAAFSRLLPRQWVMSGDVGSGSPNILVIVFDAWSATNTSLYGYPRQTTPHLEELSANAIVYHHHVAGGHYTVPGVASLLTGMTSWKHKAFNFGHQFRQPFLQQNIFHQFASFYRSSYTHNPIADALIRQFSQDIDDFTPWDDLYIESDTFLKLFSNDSDIAAIATNRALKQVEKGYSYSLFLGEIYSCIKTRIAQRFSRLFPLGLPNYDETAFFTLEEGIDWVIRKTQKQPEPFFGYYHFFPPHDPYHPRQDFVDAFAKDGYIPVDKPLHFLHKGIGQPEWARHQRQRYDEFILYMDSEFARLYRALQQQGILENTWLILTSDHGEMFERGITGHTTPVFYQPITHIPLVIFPPGHQGRIDIDRTTSAVDVLPTVLYLSNQAVPSWTEGRILPPFTSASFEKDERIISTVQLEYVDEQGVIHSGTAMARKGNYKLIWYFGYPELDEGEFFELYDLSVDGDELVNLYPAHKDVADELLAHLRHNLDNMSRSVNSPEDSRSTV